MSEKARLVRGSIAGHLVRQTAPMIIGVSAMVSTGIVDAYFIGRLGATELAAISFIFPVGTALSSLGVGVMVGTSSVVSRAIGAGNDSRAASCATLGVLLGLSFGLLIAVALAFGATSLFSLMGADGEALRLIGLYMMPYALGFPLLLSLSGLNGTLRAQGLANRSTLVSLSFALANWVLDPILIDGAFGFEGFGMAGAAYATVAGWLLGLSVGLWAVQSSDIPLRPALLREADVAEGARDVLRVALPASFTSSINPLGLAILTGLLAREGEAAVGGFGIGGRIQTFAVVPLLGLSGSIGAIVGQNWGASAYDRARLALVQSGLFLPCLRACRGHRALFLLRSVGRPVHRRSGHAPLRHRLSADRGLGLCRLWRVHRVQRRVQRGGPCDQGAGAVGRAGGSGDGALRLAVAAKLGRKRGL